MRSSYPAGESLPEKLIASGYQFSYPELELALRHELAVAM